MKVCVQCERPLLRALRLLAIAVGCCLFSCVSNRKIIYLNNHDKKISKISRDTLLESYGNHPEVYRVQTNDILSIRVSSLAEGSLSLAPDLGNRVGAINGNQAALSGYQVDSNGNISVPLMGDVYVKNLTLIEVKNKLYNALVNHLDAPSVDVKLLSFKFTIIGEINRPGEYFTYLPSFRLMDALALAGDISEFGNRSKIKIIRTRGDTIESSYVNVLSEDFINSKFYYIRPNDLFVVEPLRSRPLRSYTLSNVSFGLGVLSFILVFYNFSKNL